MSVSNPRCQFLTKGSHCLHGEQQVSKRRYKGVTSNFIDEGIYWQLNEMHITGKLSRVIKDIDKLKKKLLKDTYWNDEMIKK